MYVYLHTPLCFSLTLTSLTNSFCVSLSFFLCLTPNHSLYLLFLFFFSLIHTLSLSLFLSLSLSLSLYPSLSSFPSLILSLPFYPSLSSFPSLILSPLSTHLSHPFPLSLPLLISRRWYESQWFDGSIFLR